MLFGSDLAVEPYRRCDKTCTKYRNSEGASTCLDKLVRGPEAMTEANFALA